MKGDNIDILKKSIRQRRSISSSLYDNGIYNYSEEEKNRSKNSIKSFHRKTSSSYFCGSYLSSNLEEDLLNNINIDKIYLEKYKKEDKENINHSSINKDNNLDIIFNLSFHSYDSDKNNTENNNEKMNERKNEIDKKRKEEEKNNKIKTNNFISFKNNLKNLKDKDERTTNSYLLALGMTKNQNRKEQYIPTVSIIEEEKSEIIDSKSEYSNKKNYFKNINYFERNLLIKNNLFLNGDYKLKIKNILGKNNIFNIKQDVKEENKNDINERKNKNQKLGKKLPSIYFNEIVIKNNKKEENKRKFLKKNKTLLLNSFFSDTKQKTKSENNGVMIKNENERIKKGFENTENNGNNLIEKLKRKMEKIFKLNFKEKIRNSYYSNFNKKRYNTEINIYIDKGSFKNKILQNKETMKNYQTYKEDKKFQSKENKNLNDIINSNINTNINKKQSILKNGEENSQIYFKNKSNIPIITKIEYKPRQKIPHLRHKMIEKKEINSLRNIKVSNTINNNNSVNKNSAPNRKFISKYKYIPHKKNYSFHKDNLINKKEKRDNYHSVKQIKSINDAIEIIRIERINSKKKNNYSLKRLNDLNDSKNKHNNSSSYIKLSNNHSKSFRESSFKKENRGIITKGISLKLIEEKSIKYQGNKNFTIKALKFYLVYEKKYTKNEVIKQIEKTSHSENSFFIIICEKITIPKNNIKNNFFFVFKSLMKYYKKNNRFIKIYGNDNEANVISIKNLNTKNYEIFQVKNKDDLKSELFCISPIKELKFEFDAIFLCKK